MTSYETSQSWTQYRDILNTRFGIRIDRPLRETWRNIRGHDVHIDVWEPEGPAKGTLSRRRVRSCARHRCHRMALATHSKNSIRHE